MAEISVTKNFDFLEEEWDDNNIFVMEGSTRSGKTVAIVQWLALLCLNQTLVVRVYRHDAARHVAGAITDLDQVLSEQFKLIEGKNPKTSQYKKRQDGNKEYTFYSTGSKIIFCGTSDIMKLHGPGCDIAWFNEVMEISFEAYEQISYRTRQKTIMDFNPSYNRHWVFDKIMKIKSGVAINHSTYEDNDFLTKEQVASIESKDPSNPDNVRAGTADEYEWAVYGLGKRGHVKGAVFRNWEITDFWPGGDQWQRWGYGQDFGFQVSPSALVEIGIYNRKLYMRERMYNLNYMTTKNITRPDLPSIQGHYEDMGISKDSLICADQAAVEDIASLKSYGYNIIGVSKKASKRKADGNSSILTGINIMKKFKIFVHRDSTNLQFELEHYKWKEQRYTDGETQLMPMPVDKDNHLIDGGRYWCMYNCTSNMADFGPTVPVTEKTFRRERVVINHARDRKIM